jgi:hypothetical protein
MAKPKAPKIIIMPKPQIVIVPRPSPKAETTWPTREIPIKWTLK